MARMKTTEQFIADAVAVHGGKYDYSKVEYVNAKTKVTITCKKHGDWKTTPNNHLSANGCPRCVGRNKTTQEVVEEFINAHGDKYNYSKVKYESSKTKVCIVCPEHGEFWQTPSDHLGCKGCPKCGRIKLEESRFLNAQKKKFEGLVQPEDYKLIPLTQGKYAKVDNEDFDKVKDINWYFDGRYVKSNLVGHLHRFIMNAPDHLQVDHIWHDGLDNRKSELRLATPSQNSGNHHGKNRFCRYKGVSLAKGGKFTADIMVDGVSYNLGVHLTEEEAAKAYDKKAIELRGEWAYQTLNFPELLEEYLKELESIK